MVAIVSGIRAGLELGSRAVLGQPGITGDPAQGRNAQGVHVNVSTGALVVQNQDDQLAARGHDHTVVRTYDAVGNLRDVADARAHVSMEYDRAGNRTYVGSYVDYVGVSGGLEWSSVGRYFVYDKMNRQKIVDALNANGDIGPGQGRAIEYYRNGTRKSETSWGKRTLPASDRPPILYFNDGSDGTAVHDHTLTFYQAAPGLTKDVYRYDNANRLQSIVRDGVQVNHRRYDGAGRLLFSGFAQLPSAYLQVYRTDLTADEQDGLEPVYNRYDANGRLMHQSVMNSNGTGRTESSWDTAENIGGNSQYIADGYDAVGNAKGYVVRDAKSGALYEFTTSFKRYEGHQADVIWGKGTQTAAGTTTHGYDANGMLVAITDSTKSANDRTLVNDAEGRALYVNQAGKIQRQMIVNGEVLGIYGVGLDEKKPKDSSNNPNFANIVDFDFSYAPITRTYPNASPGTYVVRPGDTLQSIAQSAYGDTALWYRVAEANGLVMSTDLKVGQTLNIPNLVGTIHNNASTFKPYDPSRMVGDVTPNLPVPKNDCGGVGQLLMVIVAIVATLYTAGLFAPVEACLAGGAVISAGASAIATGTLGVVGGAVSAAVGAAASQVVGLATGNVRKFSWTNVGLAAISGGVAAGLPQMGSGMPGAVLKAITANTLAQGISVASGLQGRFDWRGVAASAVGAAVGDLVGGRLGTPPPSSALEAFGKRALAGLLAGAAAAVARGGKIIAQQVAVDAFGNALGESLASAGRGAPPPQAGDPLGDFINKNMPAWEQRQSTFDAIRTAFEQDYSARLAGVQVAGPGSPPATPLPVGSELRGLNDEQRDRVIEAICECRKPTFRIPQKTQIIEAIDSLLDLATGTKDFSQETISGPSPYSTKQACFNSYFIKSGSDWTGYVPWDKQLWPEVTFKSPPGSKDMTQPVLSESGRVDEYGNAYPGSIVRGLAEGRALGKYQTVRWDLPMKRDAALPLTWDNLEAIFEIKFVGDELSIAQNRQAQRPEIATKLRVINAEDYAATCEMREHDETQRNLRAIDNTLRTILPFLGGRGGSASRPMPAPVPAKP